MFLSPCFVHSKKIPYNEIVLIKDNLYCFLSYVRFYTYPKQKLSSRKLTKIRIINTKGFINIVNSNYTFYCRNFQRVKGLDYSSNIPYRNLKENHRSSVGTLKVRWKRPSHREDNPIDFTHSVVNMQMSVGDPTTLKR